VALAVVCTALCRDHWSLCQLVHTVIAARFALNIILHNVELLVHKGFFDERDQSGLQDYVLTRMLELEKTVNHSNVLAITRWAQRKLCHCGRPSQARVGDPALMQRREANPGSDGVTTAVRIMLSKVRVAQVGPDPTAEPPTQFTPVQPAHGT
jgi:hypothetical protein